MLKCSKMKGYGLVIVISCFVLLVVISLSLPYFTGRMTETRIRGYVDAINQNSLTPTITILNYQRGFRTSAVTLKLKDYPGITLNANLEHGPMLFSGESILYGLAQGSFTVKPTTSTLQQMVNPAYESMNPFSLIDLGGNFYLYFTDDYKVIFKIPPARKGFFNTSGLQWKIESFNNSRGFATDIQSKGTLLQSPDEINMGYNKFNFGTYLTQDKDGLWAGDILAEIGHAALNVIILNFEINDLKFQTNSRRVNNLLNYDLLLQFVSIKFGSPLLGTAPVEFGCYSFRFQLKTLTRLRSMKLITWFLSIPIYYRH